MHNDEGGRLTPEQSAMLPKLTAEKGATSLIVTHDARIMNKADRIVHMERGKIVSNVVVAERLFVMEGIRKCAYFAAVLPEHQQAIADDLCIGLHPELPVTPNLLAANPDKIQRFPTGAVIGFCSNVFAARSPKFVPSFSWIDGESNLATDAALRAIRMDGSRPEAYVALGRVHFDRSAWLEAIPPLLAATGCARPSYGFVRESDYSYAPWDFLSVCYEKLGRMHEALSEPLTFTVYALGMLGISYHLANGLQTSAMRLGLVVSDEGRRRMQVVSYAALVILLAMSGLALYGFRPFQSELG